MNCTVHDVQHYCANSYHYAPKEWYNLILNWDLVIMVLGRGGGGGGGTGSVSIMRGEESG